MEIYRINMYNDDLINIFLKKKQARKMVEPMPSFKWDGDIKIRMAIYLAENYTHYKNSNGTGKKMEYLRKMKDALKLTCDETQLKNGFANFLKKYTDTKSKLNASGFGVDPEKDSSLDKGWILRKCPYFDILDRVMGSRPNVSPPAVISTSSFGEIGTSSMQRSPWEIIHVNEEVEEVEKEANVPLNLEDKMNEDEPCLDQEKEITIPEKLNPLTSIIKSSFSRLGVKRQMEKEPKNALSAFSKLMAENMNNTKDVEIKKLKLEEEKFEYQKELEVKQLAIQMRQLDDKRLERKHELQKLQIQNEFELQKLKLELELAKLNK